MASDMPCDWPHVAVMIVTGAEFIMNIELGGLSGSKDMTKTKVN